MLSSSFSTDFFPQSFGDLLNYLQNMSNYNIFDINYKWNLSFFKTSLESPQNLPTLVQVECFWLKKSSKVEKHSEKSSKNPSIIKEDTFLLWLVSVLENFWQKTVFELVIIKKPNLKFLLFLQDQADWLHLQKFLPWSSSIAKSKFRWLSLLKKQHRVKTWSFDQDKLLKSAIRFSKAKFTFLFFSLIVKLLLSSSINQIIPPQRVGLK